MVKFIIGFFSGIVVFVVLIMMLLKIKFKYWRWYLKNFKQGL